MEILIVGAGQVGISVMEELLENHTISMIDLNSDNLDGIPFDVDVTAGNGLEEEVLVEAGLNEADLVITTTASDKINLLICNMVKILTDSYTIARVSDPSFTQIWKTSHGAFGVDALIGRADLTAKEINELVSLQSSAQEALSEQTFCQGNVKMSEFELMEGSPLIDQPLGSSPQYKDVTFGSVSRDGEFMLARGGIEFHEDDRVIVFGPPEAVDEFGINLGTDKQEPVRHTLDILGGGNIGFRTASVLEGSSLSVRVFEKNPERANFLSEHLSKALILKADVTNREVWEEENIHESEMTVISTGDDDRNIITTLMGQDYDAPRLVSIVHEEQNLPLFESLGITQVIHPREVVAKSITNYVKESYARNVTMLEHERGEVFEFQIEGDSPVNGKSIEELDQYLDQEFVVGAIVRRNETISPTGATTLREGDRLIILTFSDQAELIADQL